MKTIDGSGSVGDDRAVLVALYEAAGGGASFWFSERWTGRTVRTGSARHRLMNGTGSQRTGKGGS